MLVKSAYHDAGEGCIRYLLKHLNANGAFDYVYHPADGVMGDKYNLLRHAGTLYALFQWHHLMGQPVPPVLDSGVSYLSAYIQPIGDVPHVSTLVYKGEAKLGGAALALLMYTELYKTSGSRRYLKTMRSLAEFLLWMQQPSGRFLSKYLVTERGFSPFESVYYPGEAMLALLRLYQIDPDPRWLQSVMDGAGHLLRYPVMEGRVRGHNHWFATALAELYLVQPDQAYYDELWSIAQATLDSIPRRIKKGDSSASLATVGETAVAVLLLELRLKRADRIREALSAVDNVLAYCLQLQVREGDFSSNAAWGGIMHDATKQSIRIDYVQHTLQVIAGRLLSDRLAG